MSFGQRHCIVIETVVRFLIQIKVIVKFKSKRHIFLSNNNIIHETEFKDSPISFQKYC